MSVNKVKELCVQFSEAIRVFKNENEKIHLSIHNTQKSIDENYRDEIDKIAHAFRVTNQECDYEQNRRQNVLQHALDLVNSVLNDIYEPHWHRMKHTYYETAKHEVDVEYNQITVGELFVELDRLLNELCKDTQQLRKSFVPPYMSNVIGYVVHPYRKKKYKNIANVREKILRCTEAIWLQCDIDDRKAFADNVKNTKVTALNTETNGLLTSLRDIEEESIKAKSKILFDIGEALINQGLFEKKEIPIGSLLLLDTGHEISKLFPAEYTQCLTEYGLAIPLSLDVLDRNILFSTNRGEKMSGVFSSIAVNLLLQNINTKIVFSDVECIGGSYASFSKLEKENCIEVWRTEEHMRQGLATICQDISETYRDLLGDTYQNLQEYNEASNSSPKANTFIFVNDIDTVTGNTRELLRRIIKNGNRAGVFVVMNVNKDSPISKEVTDLLTDVINNAECIDVINGDVVISENVRLRLDNGVKNVKLNNAYNKFKLLRQQKAIISLGPKLPEAESWQKKSSAQGIELSIGVDPEGRDIKLTLSEDKPYALIIGDVDAGKSSLLHTILIQAMANYDDSEVKVAIGDFKNGAEFNIYASSNLKSIEAVVDNEDPDVMASFLSFYIGEMQRRQALFEQLEACTNKLVRKYETYRAVWEEYGHPTLKMPRVILVVDEYQSLFENVSGTATMLNELVRKGRTYGIHIVMASQRATSDNPRNSFTGDLKNYFTSRFVFRVPQTAARSVLSERCADTGRENSGISKATLLNKGCAIYNSYMGQTEKDNCEIQCFYASDDLIEKACKALSVINGIGTSILLKNSACSVIAPPGNNTEIGLGMSPCLRVDANNESTDAISDDTFVTLDASRAVNNIVCSGLDERIAISLLKSAIRHIEELYTPFEVHVFGAENSRMIGLCMIELNEHSNAYFHTSEEAVKDELSRQINSTVPCVNLFTELTDYTMLTQSSSALRTTPGSELLKQLVNETATVKRINILRAQNYKNLRSGFAQVISASSIYILGVGETENIRSATSDCCKITMSDFDVPKKNAINAYYYNKNTDKFGKVILYRI